MVKVTCEDPQENKEQIDVEKKFHKDDPVFKQILEGRPFPTANKFKSFKFTHTATSEFSQKLMEKIASETEGCKYKLDPEIPVDQALDRLAKIIEEVIIHQIPNIIKLFVEHYGGTLTDEEKEEIDRFIQTFEPELLSVLKWLCHHIYDMAAKLCHKTAEWLKSATHHLIDLVSHHLRNK